MHSTHAGGPCKFHESIQEYRNYDTHSHSRITYKHSIPPYPWAAIVRAVPLPCIPNMLLGCAGFEGSHMLQLLTTIYSL